MTAVRHDDLLVVDGLQINNWDRGVLEQMRAGGIDAVNATCAVWEGPEETLRALGAWCQLAAANRDLVTLVDDVDGIHRARADGRTAVLLGFQNTSPFGDDYRLVEVFRRMGVLIAQLTYNIQNLVGGSCYEPHDSGLTRFGRNVVDEMNRVGMMIDLSHVGNRTCRDAIDASSVPVSITHSNPTWFFDNPRNKPAEVISALAARDGVIGCCLYPNVLGGERTTRDEFCTMVARLVEEIGPEHVALGSDCTQNWGEDFVGWLRNGRWQPPGAGAATPAWPAWPQWFSGPADFPTLTDGLLAAGLDEKAVRGVLGENWIRLLGTVLTAGDGR